MTTDQLHLLFTQWLNNSISDDDKAMLLATLREADPAVVEELINNSFATSDVVFEQNAATAESIYQHIIQEPAVVSIHQKKLFTGAGWLRYAAVLLLLAGIGMGTYSWFKYQGAGQQPVAAGQVPSYPTDAVPGHNGAVLTLADGSTLLLDSLKDGVVTTQKGTQLLLTDGQLAYNPAQAAGVSYNTITTPKGRQFQLLLPDGSKVWLNAASSLRYPTAFEGGERKVEVTGEAYFDIVAHAAMPFKVMVNGAEIQVLGTAFNVNAYADEPFIKTTLEEGRINFSAAGNQASLQPGQQASIAADWATQAGKQKITIATKVNMEEVAAWRKGFFYLNSADIPTVMRQLSRWYNLDVTFRNGIPQGHLSGKTERSLLLSQVLKVLELSGVHIKFEENKLIVLP